MNKRFDARQLLEALIQLDVGHHAAREHEAIESGLLQVMVRRSGTRRLRGRADTLPRPQSSGNSPASIRAKNRLLLSKIWKVPGSSRHSGQENVAEGRWGRRTPPGRQSCPRVDSAGSPAPMSPTRRTSRASEGLEGVETQQAAVAAKADAPARPNP